VRTLFGVRLGSTANWSNSELRSRRLLLPNTWSDIPSHHLRRGERELSKCGHFRQGTHNGRLNEHLKAPVRCSIPLRASGQRLKRRARLRKLVGRLRSIALFYLGSSREKRIRTVCEELRVDLEGIVAKWKIGQYSASDRRSSCVKIKNPAYSQLEGREQLFERQLCCLCSSRLLFIEFAMACAEALLPYISRNSSCQLGAVM
jgi:hypothetical protein